MSRQKYINDVSSLCIGGSATVLDAVRIIDSGAIGICLVIDDDGRLTNTVTDGDVRRAMLRGVKLNASIEAVLECKRGSPYPEPTTAPADTTPEALLHIMREKALLQIPLLDADGRVVDVAQLSQLVEDPVPQVEAVVMAGGFGTRLMPLTQDTPKPMLPVGDRPLMERIIEQLKDAGIHDVNVTTHYLPERIKGHFGDGSDFGVRLNYVQEEKPLGTAGALALLDKPEHPLLVVNGDILTNVNYRAMMQYHRSHKADLTIGVRQYDVDVPYGVVESDGERVSALQEKPRYSFFVNAGIYLLEPSVMTLIPNGDRFDMTDLIDKLIADGANVISFPIREYWLDVGQVHDYERAQEAVMTEFEKS